MSLHKSPCFDLKSVTIDMLLFVVKTTQFDAIRAELTRRFKATPEFFANDVVAIDIRRLSENEHVPLADIAQLLESVRMNPLGIVADSEQQAWANESKLPFLKVCDYRATTSMKFLDDGADKTLITQTSEFTHVTNTLDTTIGKLKPEHIITASQALVIDKPLRSGQRIYAPGDLVVLAVVSNGAEIIAQRNIHIYAPLRGRALAGVHGNHEARIFCTCFEPELISIAGIYRTTENPLPTNVQGKPVQIWLEEEKLMIEPLRIA